MGPLVAAVGGRLSPWREHGVAVRAPSWERGGAVPFGIPVLQPCYPLCKPGHLSVTLSRISPVIKTQALRQTKDEASAVRARDTVQGRQRALSTAGAAPACGSPESPGARRSPSPSRRGLAPDRIGVQAAAQAPRPCRRRRAAGGVRS